MAPICTPLTTPGGAKADVCRAWYREGDGNGYHGWFAATVFGASFAQVYVDGAIAHLARPDGVGVYRHADNVRLRVCNSNGCGAWW
ncbi:hypothetical protein EV193_109277 [Herbihabitans rhizosphaerae]|uniref:Uncharacterized protein n=1 Tax=Herbihabitans rhizosphaerae TaxID=1872711 RepID=A0A4Q7KKN3_9PSEU|nr:hypothetical protein [Herbihabitans rhizosphaerae]RZS34486.1 hypothetical protein EV193_109277 [Herbihabitans rhizosphaerae]